MAPGKLAENQTPKHASNRQASDKYYNANAFEVQLRKLYAGLQSGKRKNISRKTIEKYGIKFNAKGEVIIPEKYKPKPIITVEPQEEPKQVVVKGREEVVIQPRIMKTGAVTTHDVQSYIKNQLNTDLEKDGKKVLSKSTITQYSTGASIFLKLGLVKEYTDDIMPFVRDSTNTLKAINARDVSQATKNKDIHSVYNMIKNVPMIRDQVDKDTLQAYGKDLGKGKKENTNMKYDELQSKRVYIWTDIVENVKNRFGENSIEYLYFKIFEEAPVRTELANIPLVTANDKPPQEGNYVVVKTNKKPVKIYLRKYKTHRTYGDKVYTLSDALSKMVFDSLEANPRNTLFPLTKGISNWLKDTLDQAGYPKFPYGAETTQADRDKIPSGLRHTFASYANSSMNKGKFPKGHQLASLMLHELQQSLTAYQNKDFFTEDDRKVHMGMERGETSRKGGRRFGAKTIKK